MDLLTVDARLDKLHLLGHIIDDSWRGWGRAGGGWGGKKRLRKDKHATILLWGWGSKRKD